MKTAHTPGKWEIERVPIESRGGSTTCFKIGPMKACIYDDWRQREAGISEQENIANARLIAASPALFDLLKEALAQSGCDGDLCAYEWHEKARRLLNEITEGDL